MDEAHTRILFPDAALGLGSDEMGDDLHDQEIKLHSDDDNCDGWDLADVSFNSHLDIHASSRRLLDSIRVCCLPAKVALSEHSSCVFSLAWQSLNGITECNFSVAVKADALEHVPIDEWTALPSRAGWTLWIIGIAHEGDQPCAAMERVKTDFMVLCKQFSSHANGPFELCGA